MLASATSNAIKAAHSEFSSSMSNNTPDSFANAASEITSTTIPEPKSAVPLRMKMLNDTKLLEQYRNSFLDAK